MNPCLYKKKKGVNEKEKTGTYLPVFQFPVLKPSEGKKKQIKKKRIQVAHLQRVLHSITKSIQRK